MAAKPVAIRLSRRTKGHPKLFALVDAEDAERVLRYKWRPRRSGRVTYAVTKDRLTLRGDREVTLQNFVMRRLSGQTFDHINNDGLDCTKANLRPATVQQNAFNARKTNSGIPTSKCKGVTFERTRRKWRAHITKDGVRRYLGSFDTEEEAGRAYDAAAVTLFGEFAKTNEAMGLLAAA